MQRTALALLAVAVLGACSNSEDLSIVGSWTLTEATVADAPLTLVPTHPVTLEADDARIGGTAGCNTYGADYDLVGDQIAVTAPFSTMMMCEPAEVMTLETAFLQSLESIETVSTADDELVLSGPGITLRFAPTG